MIRRMLGVIGLSLVLVVTGCSSEDATTDEVKNQYTMGELDGKAVEVLEGLNAVEIKLENIPEATKSSEVTLQVDGKEIKLKYHKERDSFRNFQIRDVELDKLKEGTVSINR